MDSLMKLINLTGRSFSIFDTQGDPVDFAPDPRYVGLVAIGEHRSVKDDTGHEFSLNVRRVRGVKGMPDPENGVMYVVPVEVAMALQEDRDDVAYLAEEADVRVAGGSRRRISHLRRTLRTRHVEA